MNIPLQRQQGMPVSFMPGVRGHDLLAQYWLAQVMLRLRREVCWLWRERSLQSAGDFKAETVFPPHIDRALAALDIARYEQERDEFFAKDETARHLTKRLTSLPMKSRVARRGSFGWVVAQLEFSQVECFVLALALLPSVDSAAGPVIASCLNDASRTSPTLALAQRLWDDPEDILTCFDPAHPLLSRGLVTGLGGSGTVDWQSPLGVPSLVARELLFAGQPLPQALQAPKPVPLPGVIGSSAKARVAAALETPRRTALPLIGPTGVPLAGTAAALVEACGGSLVQPSVALPVNQLAPVLTLCWLRGHALFVNASMLIEPGSHEGANAVPVLPGVPVTIMVGASDRSQLRSIGETAPPIEVPAISYAERLACWKAMLPDPHLADTIPELARHFRYERPAIERVGAEVARLGHQPTAADVFAAAHLDLDVGALAQRAEPRFGISELMLPEAQTRQLNEIILAMRNLTRVHYDWGTAKAWNESGLTALFAGPPGTGKTMAVEAIAAELEMPLYRIDLSQVVNKYIGETEKNLRRLFDAADAADIILFFDEADALFGKRTEVKDAHDRYANLEISYLLERMERFKGMAILATNRKKDLDEAFMRRLRFVLEFPQPGPAERFRIWHGVIPPGVDVSAVDFEFLAQRFALSGGHIRAIVFQACLQNATRDAARTLDMLDVLRAVQREYVKLDRAISLEQFGIYATAIAAGKGQR